MKRPEGSPPYWKGLVRQSVISLQSGEISESYFYGVINLAYIRLKEWDLFLGQKQKSIKRRKAAKVARKRNRKGR